MIADASGGIEFRIVHFLPGRIRLKVKRLRSDAAFAARMRFWLPKLRGIRSVEVNESTCSLLVVFDPDTLDLQSLSRFMPGLIPPGMTTEELYARLSEGMEAGIAATSAQAKTAVPVGLTIWGLHGLLSGTQAAPVALAIVFGAGYAAVQAVRNSATTN